VVAGSSNLAILIRDPMKEIQVAVGVVADASGKILLSRRHESAHQGGLWEFPGGKVEDGETVRAALHRELEEELGIAVLNAAPLIRIRHRYPEFPVVLNVWRVEGFAGRAVGLEGQEIRWADQSELLRLDFPEANLPIINAVRLPAVWPILNDDHADPERLAHRFQELVASGVKNFQIRCNRAAPARFLESVRPLCMEAEFLGLRVILNSEPEILKRATAAGVHLNSGLLRQLKTRPLDRDVWVGASCHNLEELRHAEQLVLDYAFLSPVCTTASHPGAKPLGWEGFASLVDQVNIPVYALGGMKLDDLDRARDHGAQGIAGISAFCG
jgi:8-oxo-dGTP diphosphatase